MSAFRSKVAESTLKQPIDVSLNPNETANTVTLGAVAKRLFQNKAKKDIASVVTANLFTISNGPVKITSIVGRITTVFGGGANNIKLTHTRTGGSAVDLCAVVDGEAAAAHKYLQITGTKANAMVISPDLGVAVGPLASPLVLTEGVISLNSAGTKTGAVTWYVTYEPLTEDATVSAA